MHVRGNVVFALVYLLRSELLFGVLLTVCAIRVIAESDVMTDFLASSEDNIVSLPSFLLHICASYSLMGGPSICLNRFSDCSDGNVDT